MAIYTNIMELARGFCKQEDPSGTLQNILQTFLNINHCPYDVPKASQVVALPCASHNAVQTSVWTNSSAKGRSVQSPLERFVLAANMGPATGKLRKYL